MVFSFYLLRFFHASNGKLSSLGPHSGTWSAGAVRKIVKRLLSPDYALSKKMR